MRRFISTLSLSLAVLGLVLVAGACGGDDDDGSDGGAPAETSAPAAVVEPSDDGSDDDGSNGDTGDDAAMAGEMDLGDFPIPAPAGGTIEFDQTSDVRVVSYPISELDNIVAFYEAWIAAGDWSPPEGAESNIAFIEELGQLSGTAFVSDTQFYTIIGTPDGDRIDIALGIQG